MDYYSFLTEYKYRYKTEASLKAAYDRLWKAEHDVLLTLEEFSLELGEIDGCNVKAFYERLTTLVEIKALRSRDIYEYARHRWCAADHRAIVLCRILRNQQIIVNCCGTVLSNELAIDKIYDEWRFDPKYISIIGTAYYETCDWNYIHFEVDGVQWLMHDGELDMVCG